MDGSSAGVLVADKRVVEGNGCGGGGSGETLQSREQKLIKGEAGLKDLKPALFCPKNEIGRGCKSRKA